MTGAAALSLPRSLLLPVTRRWSEIAAAVYGVAVVSLVAGSSGGFLPTTWGWTAVVTLWLAAIALLLRDRIRVRALELVYVGGMLAFTAWVALSNFWTPSVTSTMHEVQRDVAYTGVIAAGILLVRSARGAPASRRRAHRDRPRQPLRPRHPPASRPVRRLQLDSFDYRLSGADHLLERPRDLRHDRVPAGARLRDARPTSRVTRAAAAATLPLLAATIYFTFSRGAWYALALGLIVAIAIDPRRLQLLAIALLLAPWTVFAVVAVRHRHGLVTIGATLEQATHDGHRLAPILLALGGRLGTRGARRGCRRAPRHGSRRACERRSRSCSCLRSRWVLPASWHREGSPETLAKRGWHAFQGPTTRGANGDVGARLTSLSADGRIPLWRVSHSRVRARPDSRSGCRNVLGVLGSLSPHRRATPRRLTASTWVHWVSSGSSASSSFSFSSRCRSSRVSEAGRDGSHR